jgi:VWFA-related protein
MRPITQLLLASIVVPVAFAQSTFQEKVTVTYIEVPVSVIGRGNEPVRNLTKNNFEVFEDGKKRPVDSFDAVDFAAAESAKIVSPLNPASRRNFLLLFDLSYATPTATNRAQEAARNFIVRSVGNRDLVAVAAIDAERGFRFLTAFTTDRALLNSAIKDPRGFRAFDPLQISGMRGVFEEGIDANASTGRVDRGSPLEEITADFRRAMTQMDDAYRRSKIQRQVETLGLIARSLRNLSGRKHIVLLSEGFDPRLVQGRTAADSREQNEENGFIQSGEIWKVDSDKRFGSSTAQRSIKDMSEEFRRADVVLHAVDIQGVRVQNDVRGGTQVNTNEGLFLLANSTGGTVFRNSNDITADFDRLARQHEVVYILGFQVPVGRAGEFHDLKVKLVDVPNARVQHRGGYYSTGYESTVERTLSNAEVIVNDLPQSDIDIAALAAAFPTAGANAQVPVIIEISGADLIKHARGNHASTEVFIYAFDEDGLVRDSLFERINVDVEKAADRLRESGIKFYATLSLPPGKYAIKNLVRVAESDRKGFQRIDLTVPAAEDVAVMQPMFFQQPGGWVMVRERSNANAAYPFVLNGESFIPDVRASLRAGEPRLFTVWVYNALPDELTWEIAPEAKLVSESKPDGEEVTKLVFALERVPADVKELGVTIRKKGSEDARRVSVPIRLQ